jgi:hypothetical protein
MPETARDLITDAMKELRVLRVGETPTAADANDGLRRLNRLLDALSTEQLLCWADITESRALVPNQQQYTVGPGGDFDMVRPPEIIRAWIRDASDQDIPLGEYTEGEWDRISLKNQISNYPYAFWYDPQSPLGVVNVWPVPTSTLTIFLRTRALLSAFGTLDTEVAYPPGYREFLTLKFALVFAPYFGRTASAAAQELAPQLERIQATVKRQNVPVTMNPLVSDAPRGDRGGLRGAGWNILTGQPNDAR